jgi:hypothetical protein
MPVQANGEKGECERSSQLADNESRRNSLRTKTAIDLEMATADLAAEDDGPKWRGYRGWSAGDPEGRPEPSGCAGPADSAGFPWECSTDWSPFNFAASRSLA